MMSRRVFAVNGLKTEGKPAADHHDRMDRLQLAAGTMKEMVLNHPRAAEQGINEETLENVRRYMGGLAGDRHPTVDHGPSGEARVDGGDTISLTQSWTNAHGQTVIEGYRKNGPHVERVRVVEERIDPRTKMIIDRLRGR
jgi:hypothetical protein